jgi:hypothetical protein
MDTVRLRVPTKLVWNFSVFTVSNSVRSIPSARNSNAAVSLRVSFFFYVLNRYMCFLEDVFPLHNASSAVNFLFTNIYFVRFIYIYYVF